MLCYKSNRRLLINYFLCEVSLMKIKYEVSKITENCKFYKLNDENGNRLATIEYSGWKFHKYNVSFAYYAVEDNLNKEKSFRTLKEAKAYIAEILNK